jgi:hypothetical protein
VGGLKRRPRGARRSRFYVPTSDTLVRTAKRTTFALDLSVIRGAGPSSAWCSPPSPMSKHITTVRISAGSVDQLKSVMRYVAQRYDGAENIEALNFYGATLGPVFASIHDVATTNHPEPDAPATPRRRRIPQKVARWE